MRHISICIYVVEFPMISFCHLWQLKIRVEICDNQTALSNSRHFNIIRVEESSGQGLPRERHPRRHLHRARQEEDCHRHEGGQAEGNQWLEYIFLQSFPKDNRKRFPPQFVRRFLDNFWAEIIAPFLILLITRLGYHAFVLVDAVATPGDVVWDDFSRFRT